MKILSKAILRGGFSLPPTVRYRPKGVIYKEFIHWILMYKNDQYSKHLNSMSLYDMDQLSSDTQMNYTIQRLYLSADNYNSHN